MENFTLPKVQTAAGTFDSNIKTEKIEEYTDSPKETEIFKQENLIQEKILPYGLTLNGFNSLAFTVVPYEYAKKTGTNISSVTQLLPNQITSAKIAQKMKEVPAAQKAVSKVNNIYLESIKNTNQFYNAGNFAKVETSFGEKAFAELAEQTGAKVASPINILKTAPAMAGGAAIGGLFDTGSVVGHYYEKGGLNEIESHKGEIGGRFIGSTAGNIIGATAGTAISAAAGSIATGAAIGTAVGSVVPVIGNIVGAITGCVIGAIASTFIGDLGAEIGSDLFDGGKNE